ncbi:MAG TPA: anhydro-N-acetylmuramic acid kinase [Firmicutes bacterium]|nr:anhydro-N-acetylmuramic acid kinase [Bacillota bacterium]
MAGTSLDGIDAALVEVAGRPPEVMIRPVAWATYPYPADLRRRLLAVSLPGTGTVDEICRLNFEVGEAMAQAVLRLLAEAGQELGGVDLIGSHGQTIHHIPPAEGRPGSTLQIGEPSVIAERTGVTCVADFRPRDLAAGGHGAPLVPLVDYLLFRDPATTRVVQNIGGIANLTLVSGRAGLDELLAFDTGPGNMVIDGLMERLTGGELAYDADGRWAAAGQVSQTLLGELLADPYFTVPPPKSTGRERYGREYVEALVRRGEGLGLSPQDLVATATQLTVESIARAYERWVIPHWGLDEVILGGGGALNPTLVEGLRRRLPGVAVSDHARYGIPNEAKEAIAFAVLGYLALLGEPNNVPSATGARHPVVMGKIVPGGPVR